MFNQQHDLADMGTRLHERVSIRSGIQREAGMNGRCLQPPIRE
jgi:hypothetical protein